MITISTATGEEALLWGALKSNTGFITSLTDPFSKYASKVPLFQPPINEVVNNGKIAFERALGASFSGIRATVFLNTYEFIKALNSIISTLLTGINAGVVLVIRDDPGAWHFQTEHDSRVLLPFIGLPLFEPSSPQEGYDMMREAFRISEQHRMIVVIRITSNFMSIKEDVEIEETTFSQELDLNQNEFTSSSKNVLECQEQMQTKLQKILDIFNKSTFNKIIGNGEHRIIASGPVYQKLTEVLGKKIEKEYSILKLGTLYPLPEQPLKKILEKAEKILILEETEPFIEKIVKEKALAFNNSVSILGKENGIVPRFGELFKWQLEDILVKLNPAFEAESFFFPYQEKKYKAATESLCFGCSFIPVFNFMRDYLGQYDLPVIIGDPGCPARLTEKSLELMQIVNTQGSAIDIASGMAKMKNDRRIIAVTDDESFFQGGISSLIDACFSKANILVIILDTFRIATKRIKGNDGKSAKKVSLKNIVKGLNIDFVRIVKSKDLIKFDEAFIDGLACQGLGVIIIENKCTLIKYQDE